MLTFLCFQFFDFFLVWMVYVFLISWKLLNITVFKSFEDCAIIFASSEVIILFSRLIDICVSSKL